MKVVRFKRDVYWGFDPVRGGQYTHNPDEPGLAGLHVFHKAGSDQVCSESYYEGLVAGNIEMEVEMDIPDEKFKRFVEIYRENLILDGTPGTMSKSEIMSKSAAEADAEWDRLNAHEGSM